MATAKQLVVTQIASASALVKTGNFRGAETALRKIADEEGDKALTQALSLVPSADLSQILVGTATLPSAICGNLISPDDFVQVLLEVPKTWLPDNEEAARLQLQELFCGVVMRPDTYGFVGGHATQFLDAIYQNTEATQLLGLYLIPFIFVGHSDEEGEDEESVQRTHDDCEEEVLHFHACLTDSEYEPKEGDWDHLVLLIREHRELTRELKNCWRGGMVYVNFLPSMKTLEARKSALGGYKKMRLSLDGSSFKLLIYSMFGKRSIPNL